MINVLFSMSSAWHRERDIFYFCVGVNIIVVFFIFWNNYVHYNDLLVLQNCSAFYFVSFSGEIKSERIERIILTKKSSLSKKLNFLRTVVLQYNRRMVSTYLLIAWWQITLMKIYWRSILLHLCLKYLIRKAISNMTKFRISEYYVIFIYFQPAVSGLLAVSVLYVEKKSK